MPLRRCLDCQALTPATRCRRCTAARRAVRNADRPIAKAVIAASPVCAICGATEDLTAGHLISLANGGTNDGPRETQCRPCNSRLGARGSA